VPQDGWAVQDEGTVYKEGQLAGRRMGWLDPDIAGKWVLRYSTADLA
jgi:hypothetical protein